MFILSNPPPPPSLHACIHINLSIDPVLLLCKWLGLNTNTQMHSCYAAKLLEQQQTKLIQVKTFTWSPPPHHHHHHPPLPQCRKNKRENVNKRRQQDRKGTNLGENLWVWERQGGGKDGRREGGGGCSFLSAVFTSPNRNPWNTTDLSPGPRLCESSHAVNLLLSFLGDAEGRFKTSPPLAQELQCSVSQRALLIKSSLLAVGLINMRMWNHCCF